MDDFTRAYIECALWSSSDETGEPLDASHDMDDIAPETLAEMKADCADFQSSFASLLAAAYETRDGYDASNAGHDFWLTRNRHGAGFWDRGLGDLGDKLTEMAHPYGSVDLYVGDDELIYA